MKKGIVFAICVAAMAAIAMPAFAEEGTSIHGNVTANYWNSDINMTGDSGRQRAFPALTSNISFDKTWGAIFEYHKSARVYDALGYSLENSRYLAAVRYDFKNSDWYADLGLHSTDLTMIDPAPLVLVYKVHGLRFGGGFDYAPGNSPWSATLDLGHTIDNNTSVTGIPFEIDGKIFDINLNGKYKLSDSLFANFGYKRVDVNVSYKSVSLDYDFSGIYLGAGIEF